MVLFILPKPKGVCYFRNMEPMILPPRSKPKIFWNGLLFLLTLITTILAGALQEGVNPFETPGLIYRGIPFSFSLMGILLAHEFGHFWMARKHGMDVSFPYFIPAHPFIGTFGAFIKIRSPIPDRKVLIDVGATGPLMGVLVSIPCLILGLGLSEVKMVSGSSGILLGSSILLWVVQWLMIGPLPIGYDVVLHPIGFAGWIGLLITSLNLLPVGQLDGGHIAFGLWGKIQNTISKVVFAGLLILGVWGWEGWLLWGLILFILGLRHPPPVAPGVPLDRRRKIIGAMAMSLLPLTFIPIPIGGL
jgi:membrane-associated protease RseP (regulator of RpoE activity)